MYTGLIHKKKNAIDHNLVVLYTLIFVLESKSVNVLNNFKRTRFNTKRTRFINKRNRFIKTIYIPYAKIA